MKTSGTIQSTRIFSALAKRWYLVLLAGILGATVSFGLSALITPTFTSSTSLFFSLRTGGTAADINQGSAYTQNQMLSYAQLATSSIVLDQVIKDLGTAVSKDHLRQSIAVSAPQNTVILTIKASATEPELSSRIANSVAKNLQSAITTISSSRSSDTANILVSVIEPAVSPQFQSSPDKKKNALLGGILGVALAALALALSVIVDTKVRSESALKAMTNLPLLGASERNRTNGDSRPVMLRLPNGSAAERFRQIRASLRFAAASHEMKVIALTSATPSEGKTHTSMNLAVALAETKERILLIDADLRRPRVAASIGLEGSVGLTTVLVGDVSFQDAVQRFGNTSLEILAAGVTPPNPAELLGSSHMKHLLEQAKLDYDFVIVDTAPVLAVADVAVIAHRVDSVVLVVDSTKLRQAQLDQAAAALETAGAHVSGIILNRVKPANPKGVYYRDTASEGTHARRKLRLELAAPATTDAGIQVNSSESL